MGSGTRVSRVVFPRSRCARKRTRPGDDDDYYYYVFQTYEEALQYSENNPGTGEPLALVLQQLATFGVGGDCKTDDVITPGAEYVGKVIPVELATSATSITPNQRMRR